MMHSAFGVFGLMEMGPIPEVLTAASKYECSRLDSRNGFLILP